MHVLKNNVDLKKTDKVGGAPPCIDLYSVIEYLTG